MEFRYRNFPSQRTRQHSKDVTKAEGRERERKEEDVFQTPTGVFETFLGGGGGACLVLELTRVEHSLKHPAMDV